MNCPYCGQFGHAHLVCHRIKAIEYHSNGAVKRIELHDLFARNMPLIPEKQPTRLASWDDVAAQSFL